MRSKKSLLLVGMVAFAAVMFLALGCSDDDQPAPTTPSTDDNTFEDLLQVVQTQVHQYLDSTASSMYAGLRVATFIETGNDDDLGGAYLGSGIPDSVQNRNPWIVVYVTDLQSGTGLKTVLDSITYVVGGHLSSSPVDATGMYTRHKFDYVSEDTAVTFTDLSNDGDLDITGIDGESAHVNGTYIVQLRDKVVSEDSTVWNNWTFDMTLNDLQFAKSGGAFNSGCPNSGTCTVNVEWLYANGEDVAVITEWQLDITFTDGVMAVAVTTGQLSADYEHTLCTP